MFAACLLVLFACLIAVRHGIFSDTGLHSGWRNLFDTTIESHLSRFANRWPRFDLAISLLAEHNLFKGAPIVFFSWAAFFQKHRSGDNRAEGRGKMIGVVPLAIAGLILGRALAIILPFRPRPFRTAALHFQLLDGMSSIYQWSSFPSDHAILFMALAVGIFYASRRLGVLAICYVAFFICGPRLYLGIHWPTDILAGAALGTGIAAFATIPAYQTFVWKWALRAWNSHPGTIAASIFLVSYEITDLFDAPIAIASRLLKHKHF